MSVGEMQAVLARLYVDGPFLQLFCEHPDQILAGYQLSPRERSALTGIDKDALGDFASSLRTKTFGRFKNPFRLIHAAEPQAVARIFQRFYELRTIRPNERFFEPTRELGEFLERTFRDSRLGPPWAAELTRYETAFFETRFAARPDWPALPGPEDPPPEVDFETIPRLRPGIRILRFDYDLGAIEKAIEAGERPAEVAERETFVVFQSFEQVGRGRKLQISRPFFGLLSRSDGRSSLRAIAREMGMDAADPLLAATRKVLQMGLVTC